MAIIENIGMIMSLVSAQSTRNTLNTESGVKVLSIRPKYAVKLRMTASERIYRTMPNISFLNTPELP